MRPAVTRPLPFALPLLLLPAIASAQVTPELAKAIKKEGLNNSHVMKYLDTLTMARRQHALADCAQELADLGIDPATLGAADTEPAARRSVRLRGSGVLL